LGSYSHAAADYYNPTPCLRSDPVRKSNSRASNPIPKCSIIEEKALMNGLYLNILIVDDSDDHLVLLSEFVNRASI
jgi:hypothetical protein